MSRMSTARERRARPWSSWVVARGSGMTLLELVVACAVLLVLASVALPLARVAVIHRKEATLRYDLREMRDAIDRYKDDSDKGLIQAQAGTEGYPADLDILVTGVPLAGAAQGGAQGQHVRYLRAVPTDPFTGNKDWGKRSVQDDPDTTAWGGQDVFDVFSQAQGTALDGTKYSDW